MTETGVHRSQDANPQRNMDGKEKATLCVKQDDDVPKDIEHLDDARRKTGSIITIIGSALANLSDGYQQNLASSTNVIFNHLLGREVYTSSRQTRISNALLVGAVIGILIFGYTSDRFSRKGGMLVTSALVVVGSLMATLAFQVNGATHMLWFLTIARGAAGVGVGGQPHQFFPHNFPLTSPRRISHFSRRGARRLE
jgi:drug/metabolite transporter (DMT)-like permease